MADKIKKYLIVEADTNDGDYITERSEISDSEIEKIMPVIKLLKSEKKNHNWPTSEYEGETPSELYVETGKLTQAQVDFFNGYVPCGEYGVHTIESIQLLDVIKETKLF